ncbi:hypothetical protein [Streptomyces sp. NPDC051162]|uniref:hypothetical protein n=1 Tax=unclassified Streptomyces TaxID=2593676 RepID=UPI00344A0F95
MRAHIRKPVTAGVLTAAALLGSAGAAPAHDGSPALDRGASGMVSGQNLQILSGLPHACEAGLDGQVFLHAAASCVRS